MSELLGLFRSFFSPARANAGGTFSVPARPSFLSVTEPEDDTAEDRPAETKDPPEKEASPEPTAQPSAQGLTELDLLRAFGCDV